MIKAQNHQFGVLTVQVLQATGDQSDCVLKPVSQFPDPIRGGDNILVMCEVMNVDMTPHASNTRAALVESASKF